LLLIGAVYAVVYYAVFSFLIKRLNILTPGREPEEAAAEEVTAQPAVTEERASGAPSA